MNKVLIIILILLFAIGGYFVVTSQTVTNDLAPNFSLVNYSGEVISSSDFSGKIQVVNVWAAWCPFCVKELPDFAKLQEAFPEIVVIGINRGEKEETAKEYITDLGVSERMTFLADENSSYYKSIGGFSMPETLFVDENGVIFLHKRGPLTFEEMKEIINQMK